MRSEPNPEIRNSGRTKKPKRIRKGDTTPRYQSGRKKGKLSELPEHLKPYRFSATHQPDPAKKRTTTDSFRRMCREYTPQAFLNIARIADIEEGFKMGFKGNVILDANMYLIDHAVGKAVQGIAVQLQHLDRDGAVLSPDDPNYVPDSGARPLTLEEKLKWSTVLLGSLSEVKGLPENVQKLIASHMGKLNVGNSGGAEEAEVISTTSTPNGNGKASTTH